MPEQPPYRCFIFMANRFMQRRGALAVALVDASAKAVAHLAINALPGSSCLGKFLGLSALELEKYESLQQQESYREMLSKEMNAAHVWRVAVSPPWEHALLTPKPDVQDRITALIQAKGDAGRGIREWGKETYG